MRGHQALTEARLNGSKISNVWVIFVDAPPPKAFSPLWDPEQLLENGFMPEIHIYKGDNISTLDLRCLTGLIVHLVAQKPEQLNKFLRSLKRFKPASIYACDASGVIEYHHPEKQK